MKKTPLYILFFILSATALFAADGFVQLPTDSSGKKLRTQNQTIGADDVHQQGVLVCSPTTSACADVKATSTPATAADRAVVTSSHMANSSVKVGDGTNTMPSGDVASRAIFFKETDGTNTSAVKAASTPALVTDPAQVVAQSPNGYNLCSNPSVTIASVFGSTSGTSAVQLIALVAGQKIYVCSMTIVGVSGTSPTFSLVYGTGSNCATGQTTIIGSWTTSANTLYQFANPVAIVPVGNAVCYLDTGTTPVQRYAITYVQQ